MDPEFFTIEQAKEFNMWPNADLISRGIFPYINRLKTDKINLTIKGDLKGENIYDLIENCPKISRIYVSNDYGENEERLRAIYKKNLENHSDKIKEVKGKKVDVVCIEKTSCTSEKLELYYESVRSNGIFCGNGHESHDVKEALRLFRRKCKIGTPILVANRSVWFWYKR